ncbi:cyclic peptide export ABC transporter [Tengunoibacter tsumagoiensis]|uniref:Cyclic peptide transporter n=1 Tax=Tengunoibacter tsumagoiensis TaxID=2014871 RepID=A0A402A975_9CHLR|nr:cyclic peptide export ABC transporter [Tengunoibacter tsumagoiensis]GCE15734.1 hypothetical protein KTT_55930 [Tengunoibacter tsumagoiensis]
MKIIKIILLLIVCLALLPGVAHASAHPAAAPSQQKSLTTTIDTYMQEQVKNAKIPGFAAAVIENNQVIYRLNSGDARTANAQGPVTSSTLFELGSNSKAFTGLAILQLEDQHLLSGQESVSTYLPWFWLTYKGEKATITLDELLHHTSGIGAETIGSIPTSSSNTALQETVKTLVGTELKHQPGKTFEYATINYDVLGLIIQSVTNETYESYIHDHILLPLGLNHTYVGRQSLPPAQLPIGYKACFYTTCPYQAPDYYGNTPAGYILSDQADMIRWTEIQLGTIAVPAPFQQLIQQSHIPDRSVAPDTDGSSYAIGWSVYQIGSGLISHDGANPNFSSYVGMLPAQKVSVILMGNIDYSNMHAMGKGILDLILGNTPSTMDEEQYTKIDQTTSFLTLLFIPVALVLLWFLGGDIVQLFQRKRKFVPLRLQKVMELGASFLLLGLFAWSLYNVPILFFPGMPWSFIIVWGPVTILSAVSMIIVTAALVYICYLMTTLTYGVNERVYYWLTVFSIISGIGNAFIIFVINDTFTRTDNLTNGLLIYFVIGIVTYVFGQRFVRRKVIGLTNNLLYTQRVRLLRAVQDTPYRTFETLERGSLIAGLNNDTEVISNCVSLAITGMTNLATMVCCLAYLGFMNALGLLIALVVIVSTAGAYFMVGQRSEQSWEIMRDAQNKFFRLIDDMLDGFKELQLSSRKRTAFQQDIEASCEEYKEQRIRGEIRFADVFVLGELLFVIVIGFVSFVYPYIFPNLPKGVLQSYVFVFLYMTGPVNAVLEAYPQVLRMRVSWKRILELSNRLAKTAIERQAIPATVFNDEDELHIDIQHVLFEYTDKDGKTFALGPIDYSFRSSEVVFITGGNGSGKSTLAKIITGLYSPDEGSVRLNGEAIPPDHLSEYYSAIFSDFYLFEKLYGLDLDGQEEKIQEYLELLRMLDKVQIQNGRFSTTRLSTGQRKRLALLISYLEDRPVCIYDEWASDQDPEYRAFFYNDIVPALRARGKCVIIITHDDRYFHLADKVLKLEMGKTVPVAVEGR